MGTQIGSQYRETLEEAGYRLVSKNDEYALLENKDTNKLELWAEKDDYAGYVIEIDGVGYEFVSQRR